MYQDGKVTRQKGLVQVALHKTGCGRCVCELGQYRERSDQMQDSTSHINGTRRRLSLASGRSARGTVKIVQFDLDDFGSTYQVEFHL